MGPDHDVQLPASKVQEESFLRTRSPETGERPHPYRVVGQTLLKRAPMLFHQDCGGGQNRHLLSVLDGLEGSPDRHLRLPVPHVSTDQTVHGPGPFHVPLDLCGDFPLVRGVLIEE